MDLMKKIEELTEKRDEINAKEAKAALVIKNRHNLTYQTTENYKNMVENDEILKKYSQMSLDNLETLRAQYYWQAIEINGEIGTLSNEIEKQKLELAKKYFEREKTEEEKKKIQELSKKIAESEDDHSLIEKIVAFYEKTNLEEGFEFTNLLIDAMYQLPLERMIEFVEKTVQYDVVNQYMGSSDHFHSVLVESYEKVRERKGA